MPEHDEEYGQGWGGSVYEKVTCPSGARCLLRTLQPGDLIGEDALGSMDLLGPKIMEMIKKAGTPSASPAAALEKAAEIERGVAEMTSSLSSPIKVLSFMDKVVLKAVAKPQLVIPPENYADREQGVFYIDTVGMSDKLFIFNRVMKDIRELDQFSDAAPHLDVVAGSPGVSNATESVAADGRAGGVLP